MKITSQSLFAVVEEAMQKAKQGYVLSKAGYTAGTGEFWAEVEPDNLASPPPPQISEDRRPRNARPGEWSGRKVPDISKLPTDKPPAENLLGDEPDLLDQVAAGTTIRKSDDDEN